MGTLHEDQYTFFITSRSIRLRMRGISDESCRENQNTHYMLNKFFFPKKRTLYEIMWKNTVKCGKPQMTIWRMRIACWIPNSTNTHSENVIIIFHYNNGCTNAPQRYVIRTSPVLFLQECSKYSPLTRSTLNAPSPDDFNSKKGLVCECEPRATD